MDSSLPISSPAWLNSSLNASRVTSDVAGSKRWAWNRGKPTMPAFAIAASAASARRRWWAGSVRRFGRRKIAVFGKWYLVLGRLTRQCRLIPTQIPNTDYQIPNSPTTDHSTPHIPRHPVNLYPNPGTVTISFGCRGSSSNFCRRPPTWTSMVRVKVSSL